MKIEKLPSGSYRVRKMYKGKMYTVIFEGKPTQKEAMLKMAEKLERAQESHKSMTFKGEIVKLMKMNGITQTDLGKALNLSQSRICEMLKMEGKNVNPDPFTYGDLLTICEFFEVSEEVKLRWLTM